MTNSMKLQTILINQDWHNYEFTDAEIDEGRESLTWDLCEVLWNKMQMIKESLEDLVRENGDETNELEAHLQTIHDVSTILGFLDENKLKYLTQECAYCHAPMQTFVRAHHHTGNGVDVTV